MAIQGRAPVLAAAVLLVLAASSGGATPGSSFRPFFRAAGLTGEYWGPNLSAIPATPGVPAGAPNLTQTDSTVNFADGTWPSPFSSGGVSADNFVVRWTGWILSPITGTVTFYTNTDDGVELVLNNSATATISNWTDHAPTDNQGNFDMTLNQWFPIKLTFYEKGGGAVCALSWSYAGQARVTIPAGNLSTTAPPPPPAPTLALSTPQNRTPVINLSWSSVTNASAYELWRSNQSGTETLYQTINAPTTTYSDTGVTFGTTYFYVVRAVVFGQSSANSNEVSGMPQPIPPRTSTVGTERDPCGCGSTSTPGSAGLAALAAAALWILCLRRR